MDIYLISTLLFLPAMIQGRSPAPDCPPIGCWTGCTPIIDFGTGCPKCHCPRTCTLPINPPPDWCPQDPPCPADCTPEYIRTPRNGCFTCQCSTSCPPVNSCPPVRCGAGCTSKIDLTTGCPKCHCRPTCTLPWNPPPDYCPFDPPCPADCTPEYIRNPRNGCYICQCSTSCPPANKCRDQVVNCRKYIEHCAEGGYIHVYCKKTCGVCIDDSVLPTNCDENGNPVICALDARTMCGSDGVTYYGSCDFQRAKCKDPQLEEIPCGPTDDCDENPDPLSCVFDLSPVCGSDGISYYGSCDFRQARCINPKLKEVPCGSPEGGYE